MSFTYFQIERVELPVEVPTELFFELEHVPLNFSSQKRLDNNIDYRKCMSMYAPWSECYKAKEEKRLESFQKKDDGQLALL